MRKYKCKKILIAITVLVCFLLTALSDGNTLKAEAAGRPVSFSSCQIIGDEVVCQLSCGSKPSSDDGNFYIYADEVYQDGPTGEIVASVKAGSFATARFPLNYNTSSSHLSQKFLVAVKSGGQMIQVSDEHYITNPEAVASYTSDRIPAGIKGLLPDPARFSLKELEELGIQQVVYNVSLGKLCSEEGAPAAIPFTYNDKTYYYDHGVLNGYDNLVKHCNSLGIQVTLVLLNTGDSTYGQELLHPLSLDGSSPGYALNIDDEAGTERLKSIGALLGQRYSGRLDYGQVDNWILGNEVNARTEWWYSSSTSLDTNVNMYVKAFRILYNELKGMNANVCIYNSIDQEWNRQSNPGSFLAKEYLDQFNYYMQREGNIDWGLSYHPYNSPLYDPYAWNGPEVWVKDNLSTPYITMQNIDLLIDYMHRPEFLSPSGEVRSISLAEIGYTSDFGTENQEASIAYGYLKAASLPDIDSFMLFRQTDDAHELESHLALGLVDLKGNHKPGYEMYKNLGSANDADAKARASEIIGMDIMKMIDENIVWTRSGSGVVN